jgi:outer membrane protein assembly factor BamB
LDETPPSPDSDYGDSILRLHSFRGNTLNGVNVSVAGWFTPYDQLHLAQTDGDLGSGAAILFPSQNSGHGPVHLLTQVGKEGVVYLIDRDNMGEYNPQNNSQIRQSFSGPAFGVWGTPALWRNNLYVGGQGDTLRQFTFDPGTELFNPAVASQSTQFFRYPGTTPSISSESGVHGMVWAIDASLYGYASPNAGVNCYVVPVPAACTGPAVLHAYSATNLAVEYWNSSMAANNRGRAGNAVKFTPPTIANGKVYVGTRTEVDVYGLLAN